MENRLALVDKKTKRVKDIILVESFDDAHLWENDETLAIADEDSKAYVFGLWDGKSFKLPTEDYLIEIGISQPKEEVDA